MICQATLTDIDQIKKIADRHKKELGFVMRPALIEAVNRGELLYHPGGAFCHYHTRRDGWTVIYEICSEIAGQGVGRAMVEMLPRPLRLKCPVDNSANGFYHHIGMELAGTEPGKKRALNVWTLKLSRIPTQESQPQLSLQLQLLLPVPTQESRSRVVQLA